MSTSFSVAIQVRVDLVGHHLPGVYIPKDCLWGSLSIIHSGKGLTKIHSVLESHEKLFTSFSGAVTGPCGPCGASPSMGIHTQRLPLVVSVNHSFVSDIVVLCLHA